MGAKSAAGRPVTQIIGDFVRVLSDADSTESVLSALGDFCTEAFPVHGVGVLLANPKGGLEVATANTEAGQRVEHLEAELREGPCTTCMEVGEQIAEPDLASVAERYPKFVPRALEAGVHSIHALPMANRGRQVGALDLICLEPRDLAAEDLAHAQILADLTITFIANRRAFDEATTLAQQLQLALDSRVVIEQAKGKLSERHGITVSDAFERLRRHARNKGLKLHDVARTVLAGDLDV